MLNAGANFMAVQCVPLPTHLHPLVGSIGGKRSTVSIPDPPECPGTLTCDHAESPGIGCSDEGKERSRFLRCARLACKLQEEHVVAKVAPSTFINQCLPDVRKRWATDEEVRQVLD